MSKDLEIKDRKQKDYLSRKAELNELFDSQLIENGYSGVIGIMCESKDLYKTLPEMDIDIMSDYIEKILSKPISEEMDNKLIDTLHYIRPLTEKSLNYFKSLKARLPRSIPYIDEAIEETKNYLEIMGDRKSALERNRQSDEESYSDYKSRNARKRLEYFSEEDLLKAIQDEDVNRVIDLLTVHKVPLNEDIIEAGLESSIPVINDLINDLMIEGLSKGVSSLSLS